MAGSETYKGPDDSVCSHCGASKRVTYDSQTGYEQVQSFHNKFDLPIGDIDQLTHDSKVINFRMNFLYEELCELETALYISDRVGAFDALLDLVYVAYGTALFLGIDQQQWKAGMNAVHHANMTKVRATSSSESKRNTSLDVVKPSGWVGPEATLEEILDGDK